MVLLATIRKKSCVSVLNRLTLLVALLVALFTAVGHGSAVYADITCTIDVDAIADDNPDGGCTLREAIDVANAGAGAGQQLNGCTVSQSGSGAPITYELNLPAYTYTLTGAAGEDDNASGDLDVKANVVLNGQGAGKTILDGGALDRVLDISVPGGDLVVEVYGLTVQNGQTTDTGGGIHTYDATLRISDSTISGNSASNGGGIDNLSAMTVTHSLISNNRATNWGGGIRNGALGRLYLANSTVYSNTADLGGGLSSSELMTVTHSTVYSNTARKGGGVYVVLDTSRAYIVNSTISANEADVDGGGLYQNHQTASTSLVNVTVTGNIADDENDDAGRGGGIYCGNGTVAVKNTVLAGNFDRTTELMAIWPDCFGTLTSEGYNLVGHLGAPFNRCTLMGDLTGNLTGTQAKLDTLQDNGGATATHALLEGSPAIDHIPNGTNGCGTYPLDEDQRGVARPQGEGACDIGAYEASAVLAIDKAAEPETGVALDDPVTYTIVLSNDGVLPGSGVQFRDTLPDEVDFARWLQQPTSASVVDDEIAWGGTVPTDTAITFSFVVSYTGGSGDVVVNQAVYTHTTSSGSDEASFTVASGSVVYLPLVICSWP
ncbi:MAG: right-handed parallel beta-helix repeat-containing protein [Anaerolineae bacterium]|jgi:uncharacterized repeat protein (TIGR01451 family)/CSLREA domain-containing protein